MSITYFWGYQVENLKLAGHSTETGHTGLALYLWQKANYLQFQQAKDYKCGF